MTKIECDTGGGCSICGSTDATNWTELIARRIEMTPSRNLFNAAATVLEGVWYAKDAINHQHGSINWGVIEEMASDIAPSRSETALVEFARELYFCHGKMCDLLGMLDDRNQGRIVAALSQAIQ